MHPFRVPDAAVWARIIYNVDRHPCVPSCTKSEGDPKAQSDSDGVADTKPPQKKRRRATLRELNEMNQHCKLQQRTIEILHDKYFTLQADHVELQGLLAQTSDLEEATLAQHDLRDAEVEKNKTEILVLRSTVGNLTVERAALKSEIACAYVKNALQDQENAGLKKTLEENLLDEQALAVAKEQHQVSETNYINALHRISHLEEALEGEMRSRLDKPLNPVHAQFVNANLARKLLDLRQNAIGNFTKSFGDRD